MMNIQKRTPKKWLLGFLTAVVLSLCAVTFACGDTEDAVYVKDGIW